MSDSRFVLPCQVPGMKLATPLQSAIDISRPRFHRYWSNPGIGVAGDDAGTSSISLLDSNRPTGERGKGERCGWLPFKGIGGSVKEVSHAII